MADEDTPSIYDVFGEPPEVDPKRFGPVPVVPDPDKGRSGPTELPHWSAPPTGQVPRVDSGDEEPEVWNDLSGPRWRGENAGWADDDLEVVFGDEGSAVRHDDILNFDDPRLNAPAPPRPDLDLDVPYRTPAAGTPIPPPPAGEPVAPGPPAEEPSVTKAAAEPVRKRRTKNPASSSPAPAAPAGPAGGQLGRNLPQAVGAGLALGGVALVAILVHPLIGAILIAAAAGLGAMEFFDAIRHGGFQPATMLGLTGAALFPLAAYWRGDQAYPVLLAVTIVFGGLWYIIGADNARPLANLAITVLGIFWVGGLAGFGAMVLRLEDGQQILIGAIAVTALADTVAFFGGRSFGRTLLGDRPFNKWSPKKSWEGTLFGVAGAVVGALALDAIFSIGSSWWHAAVFGLAIGVIAVIGDLFESMVKRDLKLKDMGTLIPGHGGLLDRVDAILFALPAAYFVTRVLDYV